MTTRAPEDEQPPHPAEKVVAWSLAVIGVAVAIARHVFHLW